MSGLTIDAFKSNGKYEKIYDNSLLCGCLNRTFAYKTWLSTPLLFYVNSGCPKLALDTVINVTLDLDAVVLMSACGIHLK